MRKSELISYLEDIEGDPEVRLAMQPNWPFEYSIGKFALVTKGSPLREAMEANPEKVDDYIKRLEPAIRDRIVDWVEDDDDELVILEDDCGETVKTIHLSIIYHDVEIEEVIYLSEGKQLGYLPQVVKEDLGW